jgi:hypothetical protein
MNRAEARAYVARKREKLGLQAEEPFHLACDVQVEAAKPRSFMAKLPGAVRAGFEAFGNPARYLHWRWALAFVGFLVVLALISP